MLSPRQIHFVEQLTYITVRVVGKINDGQQTWGTGFFYKMKEEGMWSYPVLVTNKHVIKGTSSVSIIVNRANSNGNPLDDETVSIECPGEGGAWLDHPDPAIDLCCLKISRYINQLRTQGIEIFTLSLGKADIPSSEQIERFDAAEDVLMVGYPNGLWDTKSNKPLIRRGIAATHPKFNFCGRKEFVIDCACFPGSSGSPVILVNKGFYQENSRITPGSRLFLMGVLWGGPTFTQDGEIIVEDIPTGSAPKSRTNTMMHLGFALRSDLLLDFESLFIPPTSLHGRGAESAHIFTNQS